MRETKIKEVTKIYDKEGRLKEKIVREEFTKDDESTASTLTSTISTTPAFVPSYEPYCSDHNIAIATPVSNTISGA